MAFGYGGYPAYMPQQYQPIYTGTQMPLQAPQSPAVTSSSGAVSGGSVMRLVASKAEVVAAQIPFDGGEYYFKDTSNGKIYVKAFNPIDGTAPIVTYSREIEQAVQYATVEDIEALRAELEALKKPGKAAKKNDADE